MKWIKVRKFILIFLWLIFGGLNLNGKRNFIFEKCQPNFRLWGILHTTGCWLMTRIDMSCLVQDSTDNRVDEIDCLERLGFVDLFFFFFLVVTYLVDRVGGEIGWLGVGGGRWGRMKNEELIPNGTDEESTATVSIPVASSKCVPASLSFSISLCWTTCTAKSCSWCRTSCLISPVTFCWKKGPLNKNLHIITNTYNS